MSPFAHADAVQDESWSWLDELWRLPLLRYFEPASIAEPELPVTTAWTPAPAALSACPVEPVPPITDPQALAFEANVGSAAVVNTDGLTPATARALTSFERIVRAAGGTLTLTSAWRPAAYQQHLQSVWDKWMLELRENQDERCQELRLEVSEEFARHQLLETQRPVPISDHTRGIGFDAAIILPIRTRRHRNGVNADALARRVSLRRPDVLHDPVHFRCIAARA